MIPQKLIDANPELREPIIKAYSLGYDAGWRDLRVRALAFLATVGIVVAIVVLHLLVRF